jgi:hypothetical protein
MGTEDRRESGWLSWLLEGVGDWLKTGNPHATLDRFFESWKPALVLLPELSNRYRRAMMQAAPHPPSGQK